MKADNADKSYFCGNLRDQTAMKKLFLRLLFTLLPPLLCVGGISYCADPGEIFHDNSLQIAQILRKPQNVALRLIPTNWSGIQIERVKQFQKDQNTPNTVVWGSSRTAEMTSDFVASQPFFNNVLPGANIMDLVALLGLYKQENSLPQTIILGIDPMLFYPTKANGDFFVRDTNRTHILRPRQGLETYCQIGLAMLDTSFPPLPPLPRPFFYKLKMLLMPDYFQTSLRSIGKKPVIALQEGEKEGYFVLRKDGGYSLSQVENIHDAQVAARADRFFKASNGTFFCDDCLKNEYYKLFKTLLLYLSQQEKREVILFFSPIHPAAYLKFGNQEKALLETETKRFADSLQISYMGSYNPFVLGLDQKSKVFIDEMHLSREGFRLLVSRRFSGI